MTELAFAPEVGNTERHELINELDRRSYTLTEEASVYHVSPTNELLVELALPNGDKLEISRYMDHGKDVDMSIDTEPGRRSAKFTLSNGDQISLWEAGKGETKASQVYFIPEVKDEQMLAELEVMKHVSSFGRVVQAVVNFHGGLSGEKRAQKFEAKQLDYLLIKEVARFATDNEISALNRKLSSAS